MAVSFGAVIAAWWWTGPSPNIPQLRKALHEEEEKNNEQLAESNFEISPEDECEFVPNNAEEDAARVPATSKYIPLDPDRPGQQVRSPNTFLIQIFSISVKLRLGAGASCRIKGGGGMAGRIPKRGSRQVPQSC